MTPWTLQETLIGGNASNAATKAAPTLRGRSGMRLSERFKQYYQLVATSGAKGDQSLAVLASDIYLDMEETSLLIQRTRQEIARATLMEQLNQSFGIITPEMVEVVGGVKSILFGDAEITALVAGPPPGSVEQAYRSPLRTIRENDHESETMCSPLLTLAALHLVLASCASTAPDCGGPQSKNLTAAIDGTQTSLINGCHAHFRSLL